jgi:hypothetical protein
MMEILQLGGLNADDAVLLRSRGAVDLRLWVFEHAADGQPGKRDASGAVRGGLFRSLVAKLAPPRG